ncbi:ABC transporter substrate-binding protein [Cohnella lupini]|uniref:Multiple sugar transport system substrate-binding protein n=1 Tax=Cohnella lupini TaxID=1294267 RepID=A0A3D9I8I4_9BACL|nr:extracellular solute-binding protein [Cohnella lupini]RED58000.1 multiple sugar transport system substrate-binding protein [Cohnella lupini]
MKSNKLIIIAIIAMITGLLAGCNSGSTESDGDTKTTLKVMHYDERSFYQQYGMLFSALFPNIEVEIVSTQEVQYEQGKDMQKAMQDFIAEKKPDVLMLSADEYSRMAGEGKLYNLESFIKKDEFDLEGLVPGLVDYIKEQSDGILYGLTPNFYSQAIYYNKDMFEKYGVTLPEDRMSWDQLLQLAARFPTDGNKEDRVYGLKAGYQTNLYYFGMNIGSSQGLSYVNPTTMQMSINTDSWKAAFETANKALKSGSLFTEDPNNMNVTSTTDNSYESYLLRDPFIGGKVAMVMEGNYLMDQLKEAKNVLKDKGIQNWDVVTLPVNPQRPDESTGMSFSQIFAIDANSSNADAAWKFISYINGDEFARVTSKTQNGGFPARIKHIQGLEGKNIQAFYSLKPAQNNMYKDFDKLPQEFMMKYDGLTQQAMQGVTDGSVTVSEALDKLQAQGQQLLNEENEKKGNAAPADPSPEAIGESSGNAAVASTAVVE